MDKTSVSTAKCKMIENQETSKITNIAEIAYSNKQKKCICHTIYNSFLKIKKNPGMCIVYNLYLYGFTFFNPL